VRFEVATGAADDYHPLVIPTVSGMPSQVAANQTYDLTVKIRNNGNEGSSGASWFTGITLYIVDAQFVAIDRGSFGSWGFYDYNSTTNRDPGNTGRPTTGVSRVIELCTNSLPPGAEATGTVSFQVTGTPGGRVEIKAVSWGADSDERVRNQYLGLSAQFEPLYIRFPANADVLNPNLAWPFNGEFGGTARAFDLVRSLPAAASASIIPATPTCAPPSLSPPSITLDSPAARTGLSFNVIASPGCAWTASTRYDWITNVSGSGTSSGLVTYNVKANPTTSKRTGTIEVQAQGGTAPLVFTIEQPAPCKFLVSPVSATHGYPADSNGFSVQPTESCSDWTADRDSPWIRITSGATGRGPGWVNYSIDANGSSRTRSGTIWIWDSSHTVSATFGVSQTGPQCNYTFENYDPAPFSSSGGSRTFKLHVANVCKWKVVPNAPWIQIVSGGGWGDGVVTYLVEPSNVGGVRTSSITVQEADSNPIQPDLPVTQNGTGQCGYSVDPSPAAPLPREAGRYSFRVSAGVGCSWTIRPSDSSWITLSKSGGQGNDTVSFDITANSGSNQRPGQINVYNAAGVVATWYQFTQAGLCTPPRTVTASAQPVSSGQPATLIATADGTAPLSYQWYEGSLGDTSHPVGTNAQQMTAPLTANTAYWVRVSNACGYKDSDAVTVVVNPQPDFALTVAPSSRAVVAGSSAAFNVTVTFKGGFSQAVSLSCSGLPTGASCAFSPSQLSASGTSSLTLSASTQAQAGECDFQISGTSGTTVRSAPAHLTLSRPSGGSLQVTPPQLTLSASQGGSTTAWLSVSVGGSFASWTSVPRTFSGGDWLRVSSASGTRSADILVTADASSLSAGTYQGEISFRLQDSQESAALVPVVLTVAGPTQPAFSVLISPESRSVLAGSPAGFGITVSLTGGYSQPVALSCTGLPTGATCSFAPATIVPDWPPPFPDGTYPTLVQYSTLSVTTSSSTPAGDFSFTVRASSGSYSQTATARLTVSAVPGAPTLTIVGGDNQRGQVGATLPVPLQVAVRTAQGARLANARVDFNTVNGSASPKSAVTDAEGVAGTLVTLGTTAGPVTITATLVDSGVSALFRAVALPGPPAGISLVSGDGQLAPAGQTLPLPLEVAVTDAYGNPAATTVVFEASAAQGVFSPERSPTDEQGRARALFRIADSASGILQLVARVENTGLTVRFTGTVSGGASGAKAEMSSPQPGSTLTGAAVTFTWTAGRNVSEYTLFLGSSPGANDLYSANLAANLSVTVSFLPTDGRTLYARLWSKIAGNWEYNDYTYTAYKPGGGVVCGGADPELRATVGPGFFVAGLAIQPNGKEGYWEMGIEPAKDQRAGGFIFGGGIQEMGATPYFSAFSIPVQQQVTIQLNPRLLPGGNPAQFSACARLLDSQRRQIGTERCSTAFIEFRQLLPPDFYIVEVRTGAASPRAYFEMSLAEASFAPGLITGGFISGDLGGFVAFSLSQSQDVRISAAGQGKFGSFGASCLQLTLFDAARNVIRTASGDAGPQLIGLTISPDSVSAGGSVTGTVTISGAAPPTGIAISLQTDTAIALPASVMIAAGQTSATFSVATQAVASVQNATITASYNGVSRTATLTVRPVPTTAGKLVFNQGPNSNELWVADGDGANPRKLLAVTSSYIVTPHWSPDGRRVAFETADPSGSQAWIINGDGTDPRRVPGVQGTDSGLCWNAAGTGLIYATYCPCCEHLRAVDADGANNRLFFRPPDGVTTHPDIKPTDSAVVAYHRAACNSVGFLGLETAREGGSTPTQIPLTSGAVYQHGPRWSADGQKLVSVVEFPTEWAIEILDPANPTAARTRFLRGPGEIRTVDFACDTSNVYFTRSTDGQRNIWRASTDGTATQVTNFTSGRISALDFFCGQ
jgi:Tol biopolymer transport system component